MIKILLVEDEEILLDAYKTVLLYEGFNVSLARDGKEALEKIQKNKYDLILLDLMMPELDGIGFLQKANLRKNAPATKIIVFSNLSMGTNIQEAIELGADSYILKSDFSPKELITVINRICRKSTIKA
jgi:two-component system, OmpR family, alkaline phosphatase synthesis response regulator PhoP